MLCYSKGNVELKVLIYVDDLIICGNDIESITKFKDNLGRCFHMKDLGKLKYFLGIEVERGAEGFMLMQHKYTLDLVAEVGLLGLKPVATPMEYNTSWRWTWVRFYVMLRNTRGWLVGLIICLLHDRTYHTQYTLFHNLCRNLERCSGMLPWGLCGI